VADWDDVRRIATALPEVVEDDREHPSWRVRGKSFVWDRPLRAGDLRHLGDDAPTGPVLGVHVGDLEAKQALLDAEGPAVFTTPHFDGYAAVLVRLDDVDLALLEELVEEAWLLRAPKRLAAAHRARG
jgi:hypothetical protein